MIRLGLQSRHRALPRFPLKEAATCLALALAVSACGRGDDLAVEEAAQDPVAYESGADASQPYDFEAETQEQRPEFDESAARYVAERELANDSYAGIGMPYGCTEDCSGHEAGFRFRADNGFVGSSESNSFNEGGQAFEDALDARVENMRSEYESGGVAPY